MELIKLSDAYNLIDSNDQWITTGNVTKEVNGTVNINSNTTLKSETAVFPENQWGGMFYQKSNEGKVNVSYNFSGAYKADFVDYCENLVKDILEYVS